MAKKLSIDFIRNEFAKENCRLLSTEYINSRQKLDYICHNGHKHSASWGSWSNSKSKCFFQAWDIVASKRKLPFNFVKDSFKKKGFELLSKEYKNAHQRLQYKCNKGHILSITWADWSQGEGNVCRLCREENRREEMLEFIKNDFAKENYRLLSKEYVNSKKELEYICPKGNKYITTWNRWQQGKRCPCCNSKAKLTIEFIKSEFAKEDYELLSKEYINNKQKLEYICPRHHKHNVAWANWITGDRCPDCYRDRQGAFHRLSFDYVKKSFEKEGYELLITEYKNAFQKLSYKCPKGHKHSITWAMWQQGQRCPKCSNNVSKWEIEVKKFLDNLNINYIPNDRSQLFNLETKRPLELDIWIPKLSKAIECNGIYWHTSEERRLCDNIKQQLCNDKNIDLLIVTDKEWYENVKKCKLKVLSFIKS